LLTAMQSSRTGLKFAREKPIKNTSNSSGPAAGSAELGVVCLTLRFLTWQPQRINRRWRKAGSAELGVVCLTLRFLTWQPQRINRR
jgi:hypothetical protein